MKLLVTVLTLILTVGCLYAQVSNVRVQQRTDGTFNVDIYYDFSNPNGYDTEIAVMASGDNGATWELACSSSNQTGDVGEDISAGTDKHIVWDFYADNPNTSGSQFKVRVLYYFYDTMTGNDDTVYKTVKIGNQWWMAENLRETKYNDATTIEVETNDAAWKYAGELQYARRCVYDDNESNAANYGYLYNWFVVGPANTHEIAPTGWHVPTDGDWKALEIALGMSESDANSHNFRGTNQGSKMAGRADLWQDNTIELDANFGASRFTAVPGGFRSGSFGYFLNKGRDCTFWSISLSDDNTAWMRSLIYDRTDIYRYHNYFTSGFSIRLVKDQGIAH